MIKLAITGGIGSGKSTICKIFEALGYPVFYSDKAAKQIINTNKLVQQQITDLLGQESFSDDGVYNITFVAQKIFKDNHLRSELNKIIHPQVKEAFKDFCKNSNSNIVIQEHPLLFETNQQNSFDEVIYVSSPTSVRIKNTLQRDKHRSEEDIKQIISRQFPEHKAILQTELIIYNDGQESLLEQVEEILEIISPE